MKSIKKLLAVVIATAIIVSCFAISASAAPTPLISLSSNGYSECDKGNLSDYNITWDATNETWILNGTTIPYSDMASYNKAIVTEGNIKLLIKGNCSITLDSSTGDSSQVSDIGIYSNDNLTIDFDEGASLTIDGGVYGICSIEDIKINGSNNSKLTFPKSCDYALYTDKNCTIDSVDLKIERYGTEGDGIRAEYTLTITNSKIAFGTNSEGFYETGLRGTDVSIENCTGSVYIDAGIVIEAVNDVTITDSELAFNSGWYGIETSGIVTFAGKDKIDITCHGEAIHNFNKLVVDLDENSYLSVNSTNTDYGINAGAGGIDITLAEGAYVYAKSSDVGIVSSGNITLTDAKITIPEDGYVDGAALKNKDGYFVDEYKIECYKEYDANDATWTKGSTEGQSITSEADYDTFAEKVTVDGNVVADTNYTVSEGSTKVTFKPAYLETLSLGDHTVVIFSDYGTATGTLTIKEEVTPTPEKKEEEKKVEKEKVANTADNNAIGAFVALGTVAAAGFVSLKKKEN